MTNSKDIRAPRETTRLAGAVKGLGLCAFAAALFSTGSLAHADVFGAQAANQDAEQLRQRMSVVEAELKALRASSGSPGSQATSGPGDLSLPVPPGISQAPVVLAPKTYRVVGEVNGLFLIRHGNARLLLSANELKKFDQEETERAQQLASVAAAGTTESTGKPMPPPPIPPVRATAAPAPAQSSAAPARPAPPNKSTAAKPAQPTPVRK